MNRIDPIVTATYVITLAAPIVVYASLRFVRRGDHDAHRRTQAVLLCFCWIAVLALEIRIRVAGGSGSLVERAPESLRGRAQQLLLVHIGGAVLTYGVWTWLVVASWRRYGARLPGTFSRRHRRLGKLVFGGLCFTAASASAIYVLISFA